ncbi:MAG: YbaK/EbsC family protein [Ardenticatenia bacterium]|nr:YbaK/EbsC family protein [Ardenticatenia bacterium]
MSELFSTTRRNVSGQLPPGQQLLVRAGYVRLMGSGVPAELPPGVRLREAVVRRLIGGLLEAGAQAISLPPGGERPGMPTLPDALVDLVRQEVRTYRQLPLALYRFPPPLLQEENGRAGLLDAPLTRALDVYHVDASGQEAEARYRTRLAHLCSLFAQMGLPSPLVADDDGDAPDVWAAHSLAVPLAAGPDRLIHCAPCGRAFLPALAPFRRPEPSDEPRRPLEKVSTPGTNTIRSLTAYLGIPASRTAKVVFYAAQRPHGQRGVLVVALVRGDMEVSEVKLRRAINAWALRPAEVPEIMAAGAVPGFASPVGLQSDRVVVVVDELVARSPNLVAGANEPDAHYLNVNAGRDYRPDVVADIALAPPEAPCPSCGAPMTTVSTVIVGWAIGLDSEGIWGQKVAFTSAEGLRQPAWFSLFRLDTIRLVGALAEVHHDEQGLCWPPALAPYDVHIVRLGKAGEPVEVADRLYAQLRAVGLAVLYDDRDLGAGAKFTDADLIGAPLQVTVAPRALRQGGVEVKVRATGARHLVAPDGVVEAVRARLG